MKSQIQPELQPARPGIDTFLHEFDAHLQPGSTVLDLGSGHGRHSIQLASLGHRVLSLEYDKGYVSEGHQRSRRLGITAVNHMSVNADACRLPIRPGSLHAVLATYVLAELPSKESAIDALAAMQAATRPGGHHGIIAYIATPDQQKLKPNLSLFEPGEIEELYRERGWQVFQREKPALLPLAAHGSDILVRSRTKFIAQKPATARRSYMNANREIRYLD